ncbi:MFS transporter [Patescibacteria group bacterium]|nr:MFS transporter [Patescibacteria group bacterium]HOM78333.1 MFS transporter [bacterium]
MRIPALVQKVFKTKDYTLEEVHAIYSTNVIANFAQSLLGIFIPIYIFNLTHKNEVISSDPISNGMLWVIIFFSIWSLAVVINSLLSPKIIFKLSLKKSLFISEFFLICSYVFLFLAEQNAFFVIVAALFGGMHTTYYWIPYHIFFVKKADDGDKKYGSEVGKRDFLVNLASSMAPLLGALIIAQIGFPFLYGIAILMLLVATLPILIFVQENPHRNHEFKDVFLKFLWNKKYITTTIALSGNIISNVVFAIFWSLMLYFGLQSFVEIGLITTFSGILAMILLIVVGRLIDTKGKLGIHSIGVTLNTILHLTRPFFSSTAFLYGNGIVDNINSPAYGVPFNAAIYEKSLEGSVSDFIVYRELVLHGARLIFLVVIGLVLYLTNSWIWTFYLGALGSLLTFLVNF